MQTSKNRAVRWAAGVVVGVIAVTVIAVATPARASDDYPYKAEDPSELDSLGFYYRQCTSFVAWRLSQRGPFDNEMNGGHWWHARNWADNAQRLGFAVDASPAVGAVAHWYPGEGGATELGHVAYVDAVNADGSVFVEEYNGLNPYAYGRRGPLRAARYIHVYDIGPIQEVPKRAPASGKAEISPSVVRPVNAPVAAKPTVDDSPPIGRLTTPAANRRLHAGQILTVSGTFTDDSRVTKVHFYAADQHYRWVHIGTDDHGGNGVYSMTWSVEFPVGSEISLFAEAFDDSGHPAVDSIAGLEGLTVGRLQTGLALSLLSPSLDGRSLSSAHLVSHRGSLSRLNSGARPLLFGGIVVGLTGLLGLVGVVRRRRRAVRLA